MSDLIRHGYPISMVLLAYEQTIGEKATLTAWLEARPGAVKFARQAEKRNYAGDVRNALRETNGDTAKANSLLWNWQVRTRTIAVGMGVKSRNS